MNRQWTILSMSSFTPGNGAVQLVSHIVLCQTYILDEYSITCLWVARIIILSQWVDVVYIPLYTQEKRLGLHPDTPLQMESKTRPYKYYGVLLPFGSTAPDEWIQNWKMVEKDFLYIKSFTHNIFLVQSVGTGELYVQKSLSPRRYVNDEPEELRISTCPQALRRLPRPFKVGRFETIHFNELVGWQRWPTNNDWYTLYFP